MMCDLLSVSRSGLYDARGREPSLRTVDDTQIVKRIQRAQLQHRGRYGRRMTPEVSEGLGRPINHKRIDRLMREYDLSSRKRRRFRVVTTDSKHAHPVAPNVLARDFVAGVPNQKWLADLTYVPTDEGWLYVALVLDLFARKIVALGQPLGWASGWPRAMSDTMPQELTLAALWVALGWRDPDPGLVHHSDRGSQYYVASIQGLPPAANDYRGVLQARGFTISMSRKGDCWDNAPTGWPRAMESANGTVKVECVNDEHFKTRAEAERAIVEYIGYYNTERRHSALGNVSPAEFERRWRAEKNPAMKAISL